MLKKRVPERENIGDNWDDVMSCRTYKFRHAIGGNKKKNYTRMTDAKLEAVASLMYTSSLLIRPRKLRWI